MLLDIRVLAHAWTSRASSRALVLLCGTVLWGLSGHVHAQVFPPPALESATSVDNAFSALGAGKPPTSTHLLLDLPEVALPGPIRVRLASELPGTAAFVLLRGEPLQAGAAGSPPPPPAAPVATTKPVPVLVRAHKFAPGEPAQLEFDFDIDGRTQSFTLLAFANGRWVATSRQVKIGTSPRKAASRQR